MLSMVFTMPKLYSNDLLAENRRLCSRGFVTDGAARGEAKLAWAIPSRDRGRQLVNPRVI